MRDLIKESHRPTVTVLARGIMQMMSECKASNIDGCAAIGTALVVSLIDSGLDRERAIELFAKTWDVLEQKIRDEFAEQTKRSLNS